MPRTLDPQFRAWLARPHLNRLWERARDRLTRNGRQVSGTITIGDLNADERYAMGELTGRAPGPTGRIDLAAVDAALRASPAGIGLLAILEALGGPVEDRRAVRNAQAARRAQVRDTFATAIADSKLALTNWADTLVDDLARAGLLARVDDPPRTAAHTTAALEELLDRISNNDSSQPLLRTVLAARTCGDAHGLDDDRIEMLIVQRGLALATAQPSPRSRAERRSLWDAAGILADDISDTVLLAGIRPTGPGPLAAGLRDRAARALPAHLTWRDLQTEDCTCARDTAVYICENPSVISVITRADITAPMVCTSGSPTTLVIAYLDRLAAVGARLSYRGDFDWPGISIANRIVSRYGCDTWCYDADTYLRHAHSRMPALVGTPVHPIWDDHLSNAMSRRGVALHEEALCDTLIDFLNA